MNTKSNALVTRNESVVSHTHRPLPVNGIEIATLNAVNDVTMHDSPAARTMLKTIGMLVASPFIGLAFITALPFIGAYHLVKLALEAYAKRAPAPSARMKKAMRVARNIGLFFAAPFVALGYVFALPVVGAFMFAKLAREAHGKRAHAAS